MVSNKVLIVSRFCGRHLVASLASLIQALNAGTRGVVGFCGRFSERVKVCLNAPSSSRQNKTRLNSRLNASHLSVKARLNVAACLNAGKRHLALATLVVTAGVFAACAGLTAGKSQLSYSTLVFGKEIKNPQTGGKVMIKVDTMEFDPYVDRRVFIRQVYERCANPSAKLKEFLANGYDGVDIMKPISQEKSGDIKYTSVGYLGCFFDKDGKLEHLGGRYIPYTIKKYASIDELIEKIATQRVIVNDDFYKFDFPSSYLSLVDMVREQQGSKNMPEKKVKIILGTQTINSTTGKLGLDEFGSFEFDVNKGRREFVKAVYDVCSKPSDKIKSYVNAELGRGKGEDIGYRARVGLWYKTKSGLKDLKSVECSYAKIINSVQLDLIGSVDLRSFSETQKQFNSTKNLVGSLLNVDFLTQRSISDSTMEKIVDSVINDGGVSGIEARIAWMSGETGNLRDAFDYEFLQLLDSANGITSDKK